MATKSKRSKASVVLVVIFTVILIAAIMLALFYNLPGRPQVREDSRFKLNKFANRDEVSKVLDDFNSYYQVTDETFLYTLDFVLGGFSVGAGAPPAMDGANMSAKDEEASDDYSSTNVQVDGIDESDIIKTDGEYIYYVDRWNFSNSDGIFVIKADGAGTQQVCSVVEPSRDIGGDSFRAYGIYIYGKKLIAEGILRANQKSYAVYAIYDFSSKTALEFERSVAQEGELVSSRFKDGKVYYVVKSSAIDNSIPYVKDTCTGVDGEMDIDNIYWFDGIPATAYTTIGIIDVDTPANDGYKSYLGAGSEVYVSENHIYIAETDYAECYLTNGLRYWYVGNGMLKTRVLKFSSADLSYIGGNEVPGYIKDRYSMDEYDTNFRIVTSSYGGTSVDDYNRVYVLDKDMSLIGQSESFGKGERIYSARFNGDTASVVTFRQTDPLYKIDLSDPTDIKVSTGLKKDGVSMYLHNVEDTDYLIGIGRDSTASGSLRGLEVVLFDNSGEDAVIINKLVYGRSCYSEAFYDPRAILYDKDYDLFAFTANIYPKVDETVIVGGIEYGYPEYGGGIYYAIFGFMDGEITLKGVVPCAEEDARGVRVGGYVYVISDNDLTVLDINDGLNIVLEYELK